MGVLAVRGLKAAEGAAGIAGILVLDARLVHDDRVARRVEGHAVQKGVEGRGTVLGHRQREEDCCEKTGEHSREGSEFIFLGELT